MYQFVRMASVRCKLFYSLCELVNVCKQFSGREWLSGTG